MMEKLCHILHPMKSVQRPLADLLLHLVGQEHLLEVNHLLPVALR